jgi:hypothetical protein
MARTGLGVTLCAAVLLAAVSRLPAAAEEEEKARFNTLLAVQAALAEGEALLQRGEFRAAVEVLEASIALIDGNQRYLRALGQAYAGYVEELKKAGRTKELEIYLLRQRILSKGTPAAPAPPTRRAAADPPAASTSAAPPPAPPKALAALAGQPQLPSVTPRGKLGEEADPFDDANSIPAHRARALLERAEKEFTERHFESAKRLFEQADREAPAALGEARERLGYCKLYAVAAALKGNSDSPPADLEREVLEARRMTPKLEKWGDDLLRVARERAGPPVGVKHTPRQGSGLALAETANFRIRHNQSAEFAEKVARLVEGTRAAAARKWFGQSLPNWSDRCVIYLHATRQGYVRYSNAQPGVEGGSTISMEGGRVLERLIHVHCEDVDLLTATLPHETTHVVLAGQFGRHLVPRWADEGMAVLAEPGGRIDQYLGNLPRDGHGVFETGRLMNMADYPQASGVRVFYGQSVSLVAFLSKKKSPQVFASFLRQALDGSYEAALRKHYGIDGFTELDRQWRAAAFGGDVVRTSDKRR